MDVENVKNLKSILNTPASTSAANSAKAEMINQLLQSKGEEVQTKIEFETALALDNYQIALKKLRRSIFKECTDLKEKIKKSRKRAHEISQNEINILQEKLEKEPRKLKEIQFQVSSSADFPLRTRHYIPAITNVKADNSEAYTIWNLCAFQQISKELDDHTKNMLTRPQTKTVAEKEIKELDQHKVNFVCQYLANKVSPHYLTMVVLARLLNKQPTSIAKFWFRITKPPTPAKSQRKIYAFKNAQYFCTLCNKYVCNLHYEEAGEDPYMPPPDDPDFEYSPYVTRYRVSYAKDYKDEEEKFTGKKKKDDDELKDFYHTHYKCPSKLQGDCWRNRGRPVETILSFNPDKFSEFEKEYVLNYCLKYGFLNPCVIRLLLNTDQKCWEIEAFINKHHSHPKNNLPGDLIKGARRTEVKQKKKQKNAEPVAQIWKHYVPCYHPYEPCGDKCPCRDLGNCETFCGCPKDCVLRFPGCSCKPGKCGEMSCNCFKNNRECDPELCRNCCCEIDYRLAKKKKSNVITCPNTKITYKYKPRLLLGKSSICDGMGIYAGQTFEKGDFIGEYVGEMINYFEGDYRGVIYNDLGCSYMFDYEEEMTLDSFFYGNKLRFVNHGYGGMENSETKYKFVRGAVHIGLYALKDIAIGDEVLFNYGENYQLDWLLEFNQKIRQKKREEENKRRRSKKKKVEHIDLFTETKALQEDVIFSDLEDND